MSAPAAAAVKSQLKINGATTAAQFPADAEARYRESVLERWILDPCHTSIGSEYESKYAQ
jgi:hypothetical protein